MRLKTMISIGAILAMSVSTFTPVTVLAKGGGVPTPPPPSRPKPGPQTGGFSGPGNGGPRHGTPRPLPGKLNIPPFAIVK